MINLIEQRVKHGKNTYKRETIIFISNDNDNIESFAVREKQDIDSICCWVEMCLSSSHLTHTIYIDMHVYVYVRITKIKKKIEQILSFFLICNKL